MGSSSRACRGGRPPASSWGAGPAAAAAAALALLGLALSAEGRAEKQAPLSWKRGGAARGGQPAAHRRLAPGAGQVCEPGSEGGAGCLVEVGPAVGDECEKPLAERVGQGNEELQQLMVNATQQQQTLGRSNNIFPAAGYWNLTSVGLPPDCVNVWAWPFILQEKGLPEVWAYQMAGPDGKLGKSITVGAPNSDGAFRVFYVVRRIDATNFQVEKSEGGELLYRISRLRPKKWQISFGESVCAQCKQGFKSISHYQGETAVHDVPYYLCLHPDGSGEIEDKAFYRNDRIVDELDRKAKARERVIVGTVKFRYKNVEWVSRGLNNAPVDLWPYVAFALARMLCKQNVNEGRTGIINFKRMIDYVGDAC